MCKLQLQVIGEIQLSLDIVYLLKLFLALIYLKKYFAWEKNVAGPKITRYGVPPQIRNVM